MVSILLVFINRQIEIDLGNNGDDHRKKLETKQAQPKHRLPEISNVRWSRHLKVGTSVGDVNNKDYTFNCTQKHYLKSPFNVFSFSCVMWLLLCTAQSVWRGIFYLVFLVYDILSTLLANSMPASSAAVHSSIVLRVYKQAVKGWTGLSSCNLPVK